MILTPKIIGTSRCLWPYTGPPGKLLIESARGTWGEFYPQPAGLAGNEAVGCPIGVPNGQIIMWRGGATPWCHWDGSLWLYRPAGLYNDGGYMVQAPMPGQGHALDATHVYACGGGVAQFFDGAIWSVIGLTPHAKKIFAISPTDIWAAVDFELYPAGSLYHYDGVSWTNVYSVVHAQFSFGPGAANIYDMCGVGDSVYFAVEDYNHPCIIRYHAGAWEKIGGDLSWSARDIWATSPDDIWAVGFNDHSWSPTSLNAYHWDGLTWTHGQSFGLPSEPQSPGERRLVGTADNYLTCITGNDAYYGPTIQLWASDNDVASWTHPAGGIGGAGPIALAVAYEVRVPRQDGCIYGGGQYGKSAPAYGRCLQIEAEPGPLVIRIETPDLQTLIVTFEREMFDNADLVNPRAYRLTGGARVTSAVRINGTQVQLRTNRRLRRDVLYKLTVLANPGS